ncbi:DegV family protein [Bacillus toyonensis]|uniref:DegV family protein n=1 Tax=Bacillus toyonensis TaxID=155322 RepID=UPI002E24C352|nr:DegV family protein [Bacillus toyonensis]
MKRCFIVDSSIGPVTLPKDCFVLPIILQVGEQTYLDDENFDTQILLSAFNNKEKVTTSQPNIGKTEELLIDLKEKYDEFVFIHIASTISGTLQTSTMLANQLDLKFAAIDSRGASSHLSFLLNQAIEMTNQGIEIAELGSTLNEMAKGSKAIFIPGSLERFKLSGRISAAQYFIGELLKIHPIFMLENGQLKIIEKKRTYAKAYKALIDHFSKEYEDCKSSTIGYFKSESVEDLKKHFPKCDTAPIHTCISAHLDKGAIGILWNM